MTIEQVRQRIIGGTHKGAIKYIEGSGFTSRVTRLNGESFMVTMDYNKGRINLQIENGRVIKADIG